MNDTTYDTSLCETYRRLYIMWFFTFPPDICLLFDNERSICLFQWTVFNKKQKKQCIVNPMICQFTFVMACGMLYLLVKFLHELQYIMAIYDNIGTNELI